MKKNVALNFFSRGNGRKCRHQATKEGSKPLRSRALYFVTRDSGGKCQSAGLTKEGRTRSDIRRQMGSATCHANAQIASLSLFTLSFALIALSLFTLNYPSIFNLSTPAAHAADSTDSTSPASLSISVPTSIQMSITSTDGDTTCDNDVTSTLCLAWSNDGKTATGSQTISVQTNNPTGYTVTVDNGDGNLRGIEDNIKDQTIPLTVKHTDKTSVLAKTTTMNEAPNSITYNWTATPSDPNYLTTEGTYENKVAYVATANDADANTVKPSTNGKANTVYNFAYTGKVQTFTAPYDGRYRIELWGAQGGGADYGDITAGGAGGYSSGEVILNEKTKLYVYVGQNNNKPNGGAWNCVVETDHRGNPGGGSTDIRFVTGDWNDFTSLKSRIIVAAGGGSGGSGVAPGHAGGLVGYSPLSKIEILRQWEPTGGSQTIGGQVQHDSAGDYSRWNVYSNSNGHFGYTGNRQIFGSSSKSKIGTSGGGGYYGGAGGAYDLGGGSGGSSYISGHNGCVAITADSTEDNIKKRADSNGQICTDGTTDITCSYHYSGYKFTNTVMIDGAGYNWTTVKGDYVGQPQPDGTVTTGHTGNGYARITYLGE